MIAATALWQLQIPGVGVCVALVVFGWWATRDLDGWAEEDNRTDDDGKV